MRCCSRQEVSSLPETTAEPINAELKGELHQLRERLHTCCFQAEQQLADTSRGVGLAVSSLSQRLAALESDNTRQLSGAEAFCQDMRCSLQATAAACKAELQGEFHQLWERLHAERFQAEPQPADAKRSISLAISSLSQRQDALESAGMDTVRRLSEAEAVINAKSKSQLSEIEVLRAQLAQKVTKEASNPGSEQTIRLQEATNRLSRWVNAVQIELDKTQSTKAEIEAVKKRVLALETAVCCAFPKPPSAKQIVDAETRTPNSCSWSQQLFGNIATSPPRAVRSASASEYVASLKTSDARLSSDGLAEQVAAPGSSSINLGVQDASSSSLCPEMRALRPALPAALVPRKSKTQFSRPFQSVRSA